MEFKESYIEIYISYLIKNLLGRNILWWYIDRGRYKLISFFYLLSYLLQSKCNKYLYTLPMIMFAMGKHDINKWPTAH